MIYYPDISDVVVIWIESTLRISLKSKFYPSKEVYSMMIWQIMINI